VAPLNFPGVMPVYFLKTLAKYWLDEKPKLKAISVIDLLLFESKFSASEHFTLRMKSAGVWPVSALKCLLKEAELNPNSSASSGTPMST
jgi:hypothetical protein